MSACEADTEWLWDALVMSELKLQPICDNPVNAIKDALAIRLVRARDITATRAHSPIYHRALEARGITPLPPITTEFTKPRLNVVDAQVIPR